MGLGQSTYTSTVSATGLATTHEQGSYVSTSESDTVSSIETLDLNTGKYTWHRTINQALLGSCPGSDVQTQDRTALLPVIPLVLVTSQGPFMSLVNPAALPPGQVQFLNSIDPTLVATSPNAWGLAADGVSAALLVFKSYSSAPVTLTLSTPGYLTPQATISAYDPNYLTAPQTGSTEPLTVQAPIVSCTSPTELCTFFALVWSPSQMPLSYQPLSIQVAASQAASDNSPASNASGTLLLEPPPLVLVHGLWSDAAQAWGGTGGLITWLGHNYPQSIVMAADYKPYNSLTFTNLGTQQVLAETIANALSTANAVGIVASKVDVIAHSMGGLVTRYFIDNGVPAPFNSSFLPANPIHQLVTIGTPQGGSPFATFLYNNQSAKFIGVAGDPVYGTYCSLTGACTLGAVLSLAGKPIGSAVQSLETGYPLYSQKYSSIEGQAPDPSITGLYLNAAINAFVPGNTVDSILGTPNDTIVPGGQQIVGSSQSATIQGIVHTALPLTPDVGETQSQDVWNQAVYWLLGGTGSFAASSAAKSSLVPRSSQMQISSSTAPAPVFDLTGYTQVSSSNATFLPASGSVLTIGAAASISATSSSKTIAEILLFQTVADPTDIPILYSTQSPFAISFTPTRLGKANFVAFAVFTDNTFVTLPLNYTLQPSGNALALSINAPIASLRIGLSTIVPVQAEFAGGLVDVTNVATYTTGSGGTSVFSIGTNGTITTTGNGIDVLEVSYGGITATAQISVGACSYTLSPTNQVVDVNGGAVSVQVTAADGCAWIADNGGSTWLSLANAIGSGNGTIELTAGSNTAGTARTAIVTVAGQDVAITQPATSCTYTLGQSQINAPGTGATGSISVITSCPIVASSYANWVTVAPLSSSVIYTVAVNTSSSVRSTTITIGDQSITVNQAGLVATSPRALTLPETAVDATTVAVNGVVNPNGAATNYWFEYGTRETLKTAKTQPQTLPASTTGTPVTATLSGLAPDKIYYFVLVAQNSVGMGLGRVLDFRSGEQSATSDGTLLISADSTVSQTGTAAATSASPPSAAVRNPGTKTTTGTAVGTQTAILEVVPGRSTALVVSLAGIIEGTPVAATCSDLPEGATCSYDGNAQSVTITPSEDTPPGSYPIHVTLTAEPGVD
jgi:hypothetical protein